MKKLIECSFAILIILSGLGYLTSHNNSYSMNGMLTPNNKSEEIYSPRYIKTAIVKNYKITGEKLDYYEHPPQRVLVIGEGLNEMLVALGVEDNIICAAVYYNPYYHPEKENEEKFYKLPFVKASSINPETVLAMHPDLILSGQVYFSKKNLKDTEFWNARGTHTYLDENANMPTGRVYTESLETEYQFILGLGKIFGKEKRAGEMISHCKKTIKEINEKAKYLPKPKVLFIEDFGNSLITYDDTKLAGDMCMKIGGIVPHNPWGRINAESIIEEDPDVIFIVKSGGDPDKAVLDFEARPGMNNLRAVQNGRIYGIGLDYMYNSNVKTEAGIRKIASGMYPDIY